MGKGQSFPVIYLFSSVAVNRKFGSMCKRNKFENDQMRDLEFVAASVALVVIAEKMNLDAGYQITGVT